MKTRYWFFPLLAFGVIIFLLAFNFDESIGLKPWEDNMGCPRPIICDVDPMFGVKEISFLIFSACGIFAVYKGIKRIYKNKKLKPSS